jgi:hypothetical protein
MSGKAFSHMLDEAKLLYNFDLPLSSTAISLVNTVASAMENSSLQYQFAATPRIAHAPHLCLLALINKGNPRRDGQVRLLPYATDDTLTINDLATDRNRFAHEKCIDKGSQFIIHTGGPTVQ